jgi:4-amino-4-deoxy-L-arabinose transferase-like glycosyltransferase
MKLKAPFEHSSWKNVDRATFSKLFIYHYNKNSDEIVFRSRLVIVILSVFLGILVYKFSSKLYGYNGGIFSLFLYSFSPNILAFSRIVTHDLGVSLFVVLAVFSFFYYLKNPSKKNLIISGICFGLAQLSKFTALILYPLFLIYALYFYFFMKNKLNKIQNFRKLISSLVIIFLIGIFVVFSGYFFEIKPLLKNDIDVKEKISYIQQAVRKIFPEGNKNLEEFLINFALNVPVPLSTYFMSMLANINQVFFKRNFSIYLMGKYSKNGFWYYYPIAFLIKTPIPIIIFLIITLIFLKKTKVKEILGERLVIIFILFFTSISFLSRLQLGIRYILPLYPFLHIFLGRVATIRFKKERIYKTIVFFLSLWYLIGTINTYPHYIPYFNELVGGPDNGYKFLRDSNIDYGQDLKFLAGLLKELGIKKVKLFYFGEALPDYYGIDYENITDDDLIQPEKGKYYAISVQYLDAFKWTKNRKPYRKAGWSIFLYKIE